MSIHGQDVPSEGVEHDAQSGLSCHPRQAGEILLDVIGLHAPEPMQAQATLACLDLSEDCLNLRSLGRCETGLVDERRQLVGRSVTYRMPCRERVAETRVRSHVLDLLGHPGQHQKDQIVERVRGVEVAGLPVLSPQPILDLPEPTDIGGFRHRGSSARHGDCSRDIVCCARLPAPSIVESSREAGPGSRH